MSAETIYYPQSGGLNGKDGATPLLRIGSETNEREVSYDGGLTWASLGVKATGENGADWQVSFDNGATWTSLGVKATNHQGDPEAGGQEWRFRYRWQERHC